MNTDEYEDVKKIVRFYERREKILYHNNNCVLETIIFYENFLFSDIIKPLYFNENFDENENMKKFVKDRMTFMDKFKIVSNIAKKNGIKNFTKIDEFIEMRNNLAHNLSGIGSYYSNSENKILFGGNEITWSNYLNKIKKWAELSYEFASFIESICRLLNVEIRPDIGFCYCKIIGDCVIVQHTLLPYLEGVYPSFIHRIIDEDLFEYIVEEYQYNNGLNEKNDLNE